MDMDILFSTGDIVEHVQYSNFMNRIVKNPNIRTKYGVTLMGKYEDNRIYHTWYGIVKRTLDDKFKQIHPTYINCKLCEDWCNYDLFKKWYVENQYDIDEELEIDKDLKYLNNKIYAPEFCVLLPILINDSLGFVQNNKKSNLPIGVSKVGDKFQARIYKFNKSVSLGYFDNTYDAFLKYKEEKIHYWKELIDLYEDKLPNYIIELMKKYKIEERIKFNV